MLTDAQWERLSPLLPGQAQSPGTTARDTRLFVEAVRWRPRCGVSWCDLAAERFGPWHTAYARFGRWRQAGAWPHVRAQVQNATGVHRLMVDSTAVQAHQVAAGAKKVWEGARPARLGPWYAAEAAGWWGTRPAPFFALWGPGARTGCPHMSRPAIAIQVKVIIRPALYRQRW